MKRTVQDVKDGKMGYKKGVKLNGLKRETIWDLVKGRYSKVGAGRLPVLRGRLQMASASEGGCETAGRGCDWGRGVEHAMDVHPRITV